MCDEAKLWDEGKYLQANLYSGCELETNIIVISFSMCGDILTENTVEEALFREDRLFPQRGTVFSSSQIVSRKKSS